LKRRNAITVMPMKRGMPIPTPTPMAVFSPPFSPDEGAAVVDETAEDVAVEDVADEVIEEEAVVVEEAVLEVVVDDDANPV
jgi:hypothetical protein